MKTAVISGGAGGLGRALATALQGKGWRTFLLDLDVSQLDTSPAQIPITCDLTDPAQLRDVVHTILKQTSEIDLVIYNAGITQIGAFEDLIESTHRTVFDVNYFAAVSLAQAMLQPVRRAKGTHLAISSVAGFAPLYHRTAYSASKHALEGFFKSLRSEESCHDVRCQIAAPSFVATNPDWKEERADGTARPGCAPDGIDVMTPDAAASAILHGFDKGWPMTPVGRVARLAWWLNGIAPRLFQRQMERKIRQS